MSNGDSDQTGDQGKKVVTVRMDRGQREFTADQPLWAAIRLSSEATSFGQFESFVSELFLPATDRTRSDAGKLAKLTTSSRIDRVSLLLPRTETYRLLKVAADVFLTWRVGVKAGRLADMFEQDSNGGGTEDDGNLEEPPIGFRDVLDDGKWASDEAARFSGYPDDAVNIREKIDRLFESYCTPGSSLPYIDEVRRRLGAQPDASQEPRNRLATTILQWKLTNPCFLELIWSYWQEEGMLAQTMLAIARRFQNVRRRTGTDPLANLTIDPLRNLSNLLWGYIQDEQHRLDVRRRAYEYQHEYGLGLTGTAVAGMAPSETRGRFLPAYNQLLRTSLAFYRQDDDTTVKADAFPVLNALRELHLILSEGAHNQYGDLPWIARQEMLMEQWILARPEFREFLPSRAMVAYPETWMDRVDTMKRLQGWSDVSVLQYHNLAHFGERILLAARFGNWSDQGLTADHAANWARYWRPEIQGYVHSYRAVTGVDITVETPAPSAAAAVPTGFRGRHTGAVSRRQP